MYEDKIYYPMLSVIKYMFVIIQYTWDSNRLSRSAKNELFLSNVENISVRYTVCKHLQDFCLF